jgi:2-aminoadipate transaminase
MPSTSSRPAPFDLAPLLRPDVPAPAARYGGFARYNFVGGHNDPASTPVGALRAAADIVLAREGRTLATYGLASGPQGYLPLREFLVRKLQGHAGIGCNTDEILITSGSLQGLDLVNALLVAPGDTVLIEEDCYGGTISRLQRAGARIVGVPMDRDGMKMDALAATLGDLQRRGIKPKYVYTIPTIQNPSGSILPLVRRHELLRLAMAHGVPVFEDDCYADLVFSGTRPPALMALAREAGWDGVIHIGSFSKSVAPALRVGFLVANWDVISRLLALKQDAGSGALEQLVLAEFCSAHFDAHVAALTKAVARKADVLVEALAEHFGTAAEFEKPVGGIFLWVRLPEAVDTNRLAVAAAAEGITLNPGAEWSVAGAPAKRMLRLCFANPSEDVIRAGVAALAAVCHKEFGVPVRISNVAAT